MDEKTFLMLFYVYVLDVKDKYKSTVISDFRRQVIRIFKKSTCCSCFEITLLADSLYMDPKEYKLRSNFCKFLRTNNKILGYIS